MKEEPVPKERRNQQVGEIQGTIVEDRPDHRKSSLNKQCRRRKPPVNY
ncbi:hypothetical protein TGAMA5MH_05814 [Trichoderma gamsii]|uniref:Uncharacterized protein n=1 Tax=Trichoderma gamsii TaxID=398673 RepID=A0A2K0T9D2_9HYPO|nr:hypothetical protein TGAMA5MH_05814 [Trichoderma gamsii]